MAQSILDIILRTKKTGTGEQDAQAGLKGLGDAFQSLTGISFSAAAALGAVYGALKFSIGEAMEAERVQAQLNAVLQSTGGVAGMTAESINGIASELSAMSGVSDEAIIRAESLLLTFTKIGSEVFPDATLAALNMSMALGTDLQSSVTMLGKALNDPIEGVSALRRVGVSFTEDQMEMIRTLVESNQTLEAQKLILAELEVEFGGVAEAMGNTATGEIDKLKLAIGNLGEEIGSNFIPQITVGAEILTMMVGVVSQLNTQYEELGEKDKTIYNLGVIGNLLTAGVIPAQALTGALDALDRGVASLNQSLDAMANKEKFLRGLSIVGSILTAGVVPAEQLEDALLGIDDAMDGLANPLENTKEALTEQAIAVQNLTQYDYDLASAVEYYNQVTAEQGEITEKSSLSLDSLAIAAMGSGEKAGTAAEAFARLGIDIGSAGTAATSVLTPIETLLAGVDRNLGSPMEAFIKDLEWFMAGGASYTAAFEGIKTAFMAGRITADEAQGYTEELYVAFQDAMSGTGEIDTATAAQNVADALGIPIGEAYAKLQETQGLLTTIADMPTEVIVNVIATGDVDVLELIGLRYGPIDVPVSVDNPTPFADGGSFVATRPTVFMAGEGATPETVTVNSMGSGGGSGINVTQNFYGAADASIVKQAASEGVLEAARSMGVR